MCRRKTTPPRVEGDLVQYPSAKSSLLLSINVSEWLYWNECEKTWEHATSCLLNTKRKSWMSVFSVEEVLEENLQHDLLLFNRRSINTTYLAGSRNPLETWWGLAIPGKYKEYSSHPEIKTAMSFCTLSLLNDIEILWMSQNWNEKNGCSPPQVVCIRHCVGHLQVTSGAMRPEQWTVNRNNTKNSGNEHTTREAWTLTLLQWTYNEQDLKIWLWTGYTMNI